MKVDLDKRDIISLLKGSTPSHQIMDKIPQELGSYVGGHVDEWKWNYIREDTSYTEEELYEFYLMCKNSWKINDNK